MLLKEREYKIIPQHSYKLIRNCAGCNQKTTFSNTNHFRVNANGNRIDVWLIYQCDKCKHTCNLSIYERERPDNIPQEEYLKFLENNEELALQYGTERAFFSKNHAEVDLQGIKYQVISEKSGDLSMEALQDGDLLVIHNENELKVRTDKLAAELLHLTRSQEKKLEAAKVIEIEKKEKSIYIHIHKL